MRTYRFEAFDLSAPTPILRLYGPDGKLMGTRTLTGVEDFIQQVEDGYKARAADLPKLGRKLYEWLDGPIERWLETALPGPQGLALNVDVAEGLRHLPWELLMRDGAFLCANSTRPFTPVRRVSQDTRKVGPANRPLRVLFMATSPEQVTPVLDYEGEERMILEATRGRPIELVVEESGSLTGLREQMEWYGEGYFDVFHLSGHATVLDDGPRFVMEDELGFPHGASAEEIAEAFSGNWPRLVFLSGCRTGQAPERGAVPSMAEALVEAGAPAVLGWALPVYDISASGAAASLYEHLSVGKHVDEAVARARRELLEGDFPDWHLLRLYADATPLTPLVTPTKTPGRAGLPVREASTEFLDAGKVEVCPRDRFVGRRRTIQRCLRVLRSFPGEDAYAEGVLLHGMGGLGKSSLAARLCDRLHDYQRVVLVGEVDEDAFLRAFSAKLDDPQAVATLQQPELRLQQQLRTLFRTHLASERYLFVFDDFERSLDSTGTGHAMKPGAITVLPPLLNAIRDANSASRVIVTSRYIFPLPGLGSLEEAGLETMRGAELAKKVAQLRPLLNEKLRNEERYQKVLEISAGNPRLLNRLSLILADENDGITGLMNVLEGAREEFREELLLTELLSKQDGLFRRLVAIIAIFEVPVPHSVLEAVAGADLTTRYLRSSIACSLVDHGHDLSAQESRYFISAIVRPLLSEVLTDSEWSQYTSHAARALLKYWEEIQNYDEPLLLEIHRLAIVSGSGEIAVFIAHCLGMLWIQAARFRELEVLSRSTLRLQMDYRIMHNLARAEEVLGMFSQAGTHFKQALALCPTIDSDTHASIIHEKSAILHNAAEFIGRTGDLDKAHELYTESVRLAELIGDVIGKAESLVQIGLIHAGSGDLEKAISFCAEALEIHELVNNKWGQAGALHTLAGYELFLGNEKRAVDLYNRSLELSEDSGNILQLPASLHALAPLVANAGDRTQALELCYRAIAIDEHVGDLQGTAATLAMAAFILREEDLDRALDLLHSSAEISILTQSWQALTETLFNIGYCTDDADTQKIYYLGQALWLGAHVGMQADLLLESTTRLISLLGLTHTAAPVLAAAARCVLAESEAQARVMDLLLAIGSRRGFSARERFNTWLAEEHLLNPLTVIPRAIAELERLVPAERWIFNREMIYSSSA